MLSDADTGRRRAIEGAVCGLGSAVLFGASAPIAKRLLPSFDTLALSGLLYAGAAVGLSAIRLVRPSAEDAARAWFPADRWRMAGSCIFGGVVGPFLMLTGLRAVSGVAASLLLNLEAFFTILLALTVFGDRLGWREAAGVALILAGAVAVSYGDGAIAARLSGVAALVGATASWGLDNNLMQRLSRRDPIRIVQLKAAAASAFSLALSWPRPFEPPPRLLLAAVALGFVSYGISIVLDVYALRLVGAAREGAYFATAPFAGALLAVPVLGERIRLLDAAAGCCMAIGVWAVTSGRESRPPRPGDVEPVRP